MTPDETGGDGRAAEPDLFVGLMRRRWARHVLAALAANGPLRYTDLLQKLAVLNQGPVHNKSLSAALPYLRDNGLITIMDKPPRNYLYAITDFGAGLLPLLQAVDDYLGNHHASRASHDVGTIA